MEDSLCHSWAVYKVPVTALILVIYGLGTYQRNMLLPHPVEMLSFCIYRDDGLDILCNKDDLNQYTNHLTALHPNLTFTTRSGTEGEYLDLWLMIKNGKIEWRTFTKTPNVNVWKQSCHDPKVFNGQ